MRHRSIRAIPGVIAGAIAGYLYLPAVFFIPVSGLLSYRMTLKILQKTDAKKRLAIRQHDFRTFLEEFAQAVHSGLNLYGAFLQGGKNIERKGEMDLFFQKIKISCESGMSFEAAVSEHLDDIKEELVLEFFRALVVSSKEGSDLGMLALDFHRIALEEHELEQNRKAKLAASLREQRLMLIMPILLTTALSLTGIGRLKLTIVETGMRLFCLLLFYLAYRWSAAIIHGKFKEQL